MERDSNPRYACAYSSFQDCRLRPLGHPSISYNLLFRLHLRLMLISLLALGMTMRYSMPTRRHRSTHPTMRNAPQCQRCLRLCSFLKIYPVEDVATSRPSPIPTTRSRQMAWAVEQEDSWSSSLLRMFPLDAPGMTRFKSRWFNEFCGGREVCV